ncbi:InlB B-repeat-containing protein [Peloplasma aerotolerans]|uniref:InlB B-repeat-containing protein n=1 Tax=Peloplasma aerotolerans TaxID=3044389 RepID=A0AAW6UA61_9MOLU|nr:InlB B-repeat-containing protein [Mariniplasma sp. M4Ah]MDI6453584.1 InlB B-repeat-containing protein [Mariniplasma sp. M4Ah]
MNKKTLFMIIITMITFGLIACQNQTSDPHIEDILNTVADQISIPQETTENINLPQTITKEAFEISIVWGSSQEVYLSNTGVVMRPTFEIGNQNIVLTATLTYQDVSIVRTYNIIVVSLSSEVGIYYTVSFNPNGGTTVSPINVEEDKLLTEPSTPSKEGYTFEGWFKDIELTQAWNFTTDFVIENMTLYAKWEEETSTITYTVIFNTNGGTTIEPVMLESNETVSEPHEPTKEGYEFAGWFTNQQLTELFDFDSPIITNLTIYAKWTEIIVIPEGTAISTPEEFNHTVTTHASGGVFYLANDIDFTGFTWTYTSFNFKGTINGNGKTISNLSIHGGDRSGIFTRIKESTVYNLTLDQVHVVSTGRAGILIGEVDGTDVLVHNISIINSSVTGNSSNGVGGLIGYTKNGFNVSTHDIILEDVTVTNQNKASGLIIGRTNNGSTLGNMTISNIYITNSYVTATESVGGIYGDVTGSINLSIDKIVMEIHLDSSKNLGGVIGLNLSTNNISIQDILMTGSLTASNNNIGHIASGNVITTANRIYAVQFDITGDVNQQAIAENNIISSLETLNSEWWHDHLSNIASDESWYFQDNLYRLTGLSYIPVNSFVVTLELQHGLSSIQTYVKENTMLSKPIDPTYPGYEFIGWYTNIELTTLYNFDDLVHENMTLYAKWAALPTYTVMLNHIAYLIAEGDLVEQPQDPYQLGKIFVGWFDGDQIFDFTTPITKNYTIEAHFIDAEQFTISFDSLGGSAISAISLYENEKITSLPKPTLEEHRFVNWYLDLDLTIIFNQTYLEENITLYAKYAELGEIIFEESFEYPLNTDLGTTPWNVSKPGTAVIIENNVLKLTETSSEAIYDQNLATLADGRYVLVFDFMQPTGGASFTIELTNGTQRIFTVGANRTNRFTFRNADGTEQALNASILSVTPNQYHQAIVIFDTEHHYYKYFIKLEDQLYEITPSGGVSFMSNMEITHIRIRIVGGTVSTNPHTYLDSILIESSSETTHGKSVYDPEEAIDYEVLIQQIYDELTIPFSDDIRSNITLPTNIQNVNISWISSNPSVVSHTGIVTRNETDDIHVSLEATLSKDGYTLTKDFEVIIKSLQAQTEFDDSAYALSGFALGHVSIPDLKEGDSGYYVVTNELEFMNAINAENTSTTTAARIIEIRNDLNLGYHEVVSQYGVLKNLDQHNVPKMHPILKQTGVSMVRIQERDGNTSKYHEGLVIFSESGHTIKHASFNIKRANNIVIRNLKFDELWEWDEATKGDYDSNDWDYFTLEQINGIWFDHVELGKAYDGLIDFKAGSTTIQTVINATFSYMKLVFEPNDFILAQFQYLENNRTSYNYYNQMRNAGMTMEEIMAVNSFQKKGFLLGGSEGRVGNIFTLTIYNSYIKNLQDRFPRVRGGDVHLFNNVYDATEVYEMRNFVRDTWPTLFAKPEYNRQLTNQALVTTENGAILMENSIIKGVSQVIKSNQVSRDHPEMTGKYRVIDSYYELGDYTFYGSSEDIDTPFIRSNSEPILPFSWTTISSLPYSNYDLVAVNVLEEYLNHAILGATDIPFNWLSLEGQPTT